MAIGSTGGVPTASSERMGALVGRRLSSFLALTKPRITLMVVLTTMAGFYLASPSPMNLLLLLHVVLGTALIAAGTAGLNQVLEADADGRMNRTRHRPLPSGQLDPSSAALFSTALVMAGAAYLGLAANPLTAMLGVFTSVLYLFVYTPLKRKTPLCTAIGAIPGAIPPLMGWVAVSNQVDLQAVVLFAILFFWQFPHFHAISWLYREDYRRGGFHMLPLSDPKGVRTAAHILVHTFLLILVSCLPFWLNLGGWLYLAAALGLGVFLLGHGIRLAHHRTSAFASRLMRASIIYLPVLLIFLVADKI